MYFEYIIPDFLKEFKFLYLAVFGIYLSICYWVLLFLRDQFFLIVKEIIETVVLSLGTIISRTYDMIAYVLTCPFHIIEVAFMHGSSSFNSRYRNLEIMAELSSDDTLRAFIKAKLKDVDHVKDLVIIEKAIGLFVDTQLYNGPEDESLKPVGLSFATEPSEKEKELGGLEYEPI